MRWLLVLVLAVGLAGCGSNAIAGSGKRVAPPRLDPGLEAPLTTDGTAPLPLAVRLNDGPDPVRLKFHTEPLAGLMFDLDTGQVLWRHEPNKVLPIASLTKMMTALLVTERLKPTDWVKVTREALHYHGTGIGLLKKGKRVRAESMLSALMLFSANDAAIALAQRVSGSVPRFVADMNKKAKQLGMTCTHYTSPDGFKDEGNHSCPVDLALLARADMQVARITDIVVKPRTTVPFPTKGGTLFLYGHNPLIEMHYPGATGLKTGYTNASGPCFVGTARRGNVRLGVVLLHSPSPGDQAKKLLDRGFAVVR